MKMLKKMMWIGLTGGIASGKSTVAKLFRDHGITVIDADLIAHQVVEPGKPGLRSIVSEFGEEVLDSDGRLNRRALGQKVFGHPESLQRLESILHPLVQQEVLIQRKNAEQSGAKIAIYDVPLLFEKKLEAQFDGVITVHSSLENQKKRIKLRDGLTDQEIEKRLSSQIPLKQKMDQSHWRIDNNGSLSELQAQVEQWIRTQSTKT
jgi:dephospho-CoA kinase